MVFKLVVKNILFRYNPESVHDFVCKFLRVPFISKFLKIFYNFENQLLEREVFGIKFKNPIGLAAGFDKNAELVNQLDDLGFGFIEIGTVTPVPQEGNEKPRLFRIIEDKAIINRMGFNNAGIQVVKKNLKKKKKNLIIGGNIGKNKVTPNDSAFQDYEKCFNELYEYVDYFVINVSSPNTPGLRELQEKEPLTKLLKHVQNINNNKPIRKPILLKIAPDLTNQQLDDIIEIVKSSEIDGVIATNTTISRDNMKTSKDRIKEIGAGGLSGKPLTCRSTEVIKYLAQKSDRTFPIIGVGGIQSAEDAMEKFNVGASLVQFYTGFIYEGPGLIKKINKMLVDNLDKTSLN